MSLLEQYKARIAQVRREEAQPLVDRLNELNESIEKKTEALKAERDERSEIITELRKIDPTLAPSLYTGRSKNNGKPEKKKKSSGASTPSPAMLERLETWLRARPELNAMNDGLGFRPVDVYSREDFDVIGSTSAVNKALNVLREEGTIRLAKWERGRPLPGKPTGKFYKLI